LRKGRYIFYVFITLLVLAALEYFIEYNEPRIFKETIESIKADVQLTDGIGDVEGYEYEYNKDDLESDTLNFKITLFGSESHVEVKCIAEKDSLDQWVITSMKK